MRAAHRRLPLLSSTSMGGWGLEFYRTPEGAGGAECQRRYRPDRGARDEAQAVGPRHQRDDHLQRLQRQSAAQTQAWPTTEGKVGIAWAPAGALRQEALRHTVLRRLPKRRVTMHGIRTEQEHRPGWHGVATE